MNKAIRNYSILGILFVLLLPQGLILGFGILDMDPQIGLPVCIVVWILCFSVGYYFLTKAKRIARAKREKETE